MLPPGVGDLETLRYWSELMSQTRTQTTGVTTGHDGKRSRTDRRDPPLLTLLPLGATMNVYRTLRSIIVQELMCRAVWSS